MNSSEEIVVVIDHSSIVYYFKYVTGNRACRFVLLSHAIELTGDWSRSLSFWPRSHNGFLGLGLGLGFALPGLGLGLDLTMFWSH